MGSQSRTLISLLISILFWMHSYPASRERIFYYLIISSLEMIKLRLKNPTPKTCPAIKIQMRNHKTLIEGITTIHPLNSFTPVYNYL
uniref:Secreted protein n=2 Tax=Picea TaxID=3328 RepID=A0A101LY52_PICGL|nr:hypothetical protein ABT39_MTgene5661 [Picea glauca]QHR90269.1 hypothetical protein Q903MT_gene4292 [Picea sitchensis]